MTTITKEERQQIANTIYDDDTLPDDTWSIDEFIESEGRLGEYFRQAKGRGATTVERFDYWDERVYVAKDKDGKNVEMLSTPRRF